MHIQQFSAAVLFDRLRKTKLRGHGQPEIYKDAHLGLFRTRMENLVPPQNYVLRGQLDYIRDLQEDVYNEKDLDLFDLDGFVIVDGVPFTPPIVEISRNKAGNSVLLICDGQHRVQASGGEITVVIASNLPWQYPYYAWPLENGWDDVEMVDFQPDVKKEYREPQDHKALYRNFEPQFPGYQPSRDKYKAQAQP